MSERDDAQKVMRYDAEKIVDEVIQERVDKAIYQLIGKRVKEATESLYDYVDNVVADMKTPNSPRGEVRYFGGSLIHNRQDASSIDFSAAGTNAPVTNVSTYLNLQVRGLKRNYGCAGDGITDDSTKIQTAFTDGKIIEAEEATFATSTKLSLPTNSKIYGCGKEKTIFLFTGANDGFYITGTFPIVDFNDLQIQTSNASGAKAIDFDNSASGSGHCVIGNVAITSTGSGRWSYGFWANNFQTSAVYNLRITQSSTVGIHLEHSCNGVNFFNTEIVGSTGVGTIQRAIELPFVTAASEASFYGGTLQGYFTKSIVFNQATLYMTGFYTENTNGSPSDGADIWNDGSSAAIVGARFANFDGGIAPASFGGTSTVRGFVLEKSTVGALTIHAGNAYAYLDGVRYTSFTDNDGTATVLGNSNSSGNLVPVKINGATTLTLNVDGTTRGEFSSKGIRIIGTAAAGSGGDLVVGSGTQTTVGAAGSASALPANPLGYLIGFVGSTKIAIPYYNG